MARLIGPVPLCRVPSLTPVFDLGRVAQVSGLPLALEAEEEGRIMSTDALSAEDAIAAALCGSLAQFDPPMSTRASAGEWAAAQRPPAPMSTDEDGPSFRLGALTLEEDIAEGRTIPSRDPGLYNDEDTVRRLC